MNLVPNRQLLPLVPFQSTKYRKKEMCLDNKIQELIGDVFCPKRRNEKCFYISTYKTSSFYDCKKCKACCHALNLIFKDQNLQICCLAMTVHIDLQRRRVATTKKKNHLYIWRNFSANQIQAYPNLNQKRQKFFHLWYNRVDTPLVDAVNQNFIYTLILYTFSLHGSNKMFSASNDGIEWSFDFGPDSVTLTVKNLVHEMTIGSQETPLAACSLLLSQRQQFFNNHLARVPVTPNQQGTHEMKDQVLSRVGAQEGLDTSGYQMSADLDDVEF